MKTNDIVEKILAAVVLGASIYGIIYFLLRSLESPRISVIFALVTLIFFGLFYSFKFFRKGRGE